MLIHARLGVALLAFAHYATARALQSRAADLVEHESTPMLPAGWTFVSNVQDSEPLSLRIALRHPHKDYLRVAEDVSNPASPNYGNYLNAAQLQEVLPDTSSAASSVMGWLQSEGVEKISHSGEWVNFETTVGQARELFNADFAKYSHKGQSPVLRTQSYSVPSSLEDTIDFLFPATQFLGISRYATPTLQARQHLPTGPPNCTVDTCPSNLKTKYSISYFPPDNASGATLAIAGFLEEYTNSSDLHSFFSQFGLDQTPYNYSVSLVNGGQDLQNATTGVEAMLDLEYSMAFTGPLDVTYISTGGRPPQISQPGNVSVPLSQAGNEPYLEFLEHLLALDAPPQVISISYSDDEQTVPLAYAQRTCDLFGALAARGVSVIDASGDGGALGTGSTDCIGPNGETRFIPAFPATCPWVTSVGATAAYGGAATYSAGGFSNYFGRPAWQDTVVQEYIAKLNGSHAPYYNASGRAFPDVAVIGNGFAIVSGGYAFTAKGTSASTPVFAAMVTLLNDLRLRAGKPVLGFLNPLLYSQGLAGAYRDVTDGFAGGCSNSTWFEAGWQALPGWDAVTGLGEPDFDKLRALVV